MEQVGSRLNEMSIISNDGQSTEMKWGWTLMDLYRNALSFYKGKIITMIEMIYCA